MLTDIQNLIYQTDGRYASDQELRFLQTYIETASLRFRTYQKIQAAEVSIMNQLLKELKTYHPEIFSVNGQDLTAKWQRDTVRVLRYATTALLVDDPEMFKDNLLIWFQTIMSAFGARQSCQITFTTLQQVVKQHLAPEEARLMLPWWNSAGRPWELKLWPSRFLGHTPENDWSQVKPGFGIQSPRFSARGNSAGGTRYQRSI
jgi:hypothetical protein